MAYQEVLTRAGSAGSANLSGHSHRHHSYCASFLLYWNEGRTVKTGDAIGEARAAAVELNDISKADPSLRAR